MGFAEGGFDFRRGFAAGEDEAEVAVAFGEGADALVELGGDFDFGDEGDAGGGFDAINVGEEAGAGDGDHHDAGGGRLFVLRIAYCVAVSLADDEFFEGCIEVEAEGFGATAADGAGGNFDHDGLRGDHGRKTEF